MVDRIRYPTVSYLPFYYVFFKFLLLTIFNLQANILTTKDILSNLDRNKGCTTAWLFFQGTAIVLLNFFSVLIRIWGGNLDASYFCRGKQGKERNLSAARAHFGDFFW